VPRCLAAACLTLAAAGAATAGVPDSYWITPSATPGDWSDNANWTPGAPGSENNAFIQSGTGATANLGAAAVAKTLFVEGSGTLRSGTLTLTATTGNLWMDKGGGTTLTLQAGPGLGDVRVTTPTATIGATDTANGIDVGGYLETNVLNLDAVGGSATLDVTGDLNIGYDGSGNAVQILNGSAPAAVSAGSIKVSIASTSGAADYNWIGTYIPQATLTATNLQVGYAGDKGGAENVGGTWTVTNTIIGDQAGSNDNYVSVYGSGTITNNGQMVVGLSGTGNRLNVGYESDPGSLIMAASPNDLEIGSLAGATFNGLSVYADSRLTVNKRIVVGNAGDDSSFEALEDSTVVCGGIDVGRVSSRNVVGFENNADITVNGSVRVGDNGSDNSFSIFTGSVVTLTAANKDFTIGASGTTASNGNTLLVRHPGSKLVLQGANTALWISGVFGAGGGSGNMAEVRDGGTIEAENVVVGPGGTLAGNGSVVGTVSVASGGVIAPRSGPAVATGTLAVTGNVDFSPASGGFGLLAIDMNAVDNDVLTVSGTLDISAATLAFLFDEPFSPVDRVLATYGSLTGTFGSITNLPSGWSIDYQYQGLNQIAAVPEPATLCSALAGLACGGYSMFRRRKQSRSLASLIVAAAAIAVSSVTLPAAAEQIVELQTPAGLNPGDEFRFVFVTANARTAESSDIASYNTFVNDDAGGATYDGTTVLWKAIGSTATVNARDNVGGYGTHVPVYLVTGTRVANELTTEADGFGLWSGTLLNQISVSIEGTDVGEDAVWTGSNVDGTASTLHYLGANLGSVFGRTTRITEFWIAYQSDDITESHRVYALSETLTVSAVPEPSTSCMALAGLACGGYLVKQRRKRA